MNPVSGDCPVLRRIAWVMLWVLLCSSAMGAETEPKWVWQPTAGSGKNLAPEARLRHTFVLPAADERQVSYARLDLTANAGVCEVHVNGVAVSRTQPGNRQVWSVRIGEHLRPGKNVLALAAGKPTKSGGVLGRLTVNFSTGPSLTVVTDNSWKAAGKEQANWTSPQVDDGA